MSGKQSWKLVPWTGARGRREEEAQLTDWRLVKKGNSPVLMREGKEAIAEFASVLDSLDVHELLLGEREGGDWLCVLGSKREDGMLVRITSKGRTRIGALCGAFRDLDLVSR